MDENVDYKELYLKMMRASEKAICLLIQAQQECEEIYMQGERQTGENIIVLPRNDIDHR